MHTTMDAQPSFSSSSSSSSSASTTTIKFPSCTRCRSPDPALLSSLQFPAPSACSCTASPHNAGIRGDVRPSKRWRRRQQKSRAGRPRLPCPRCGSSDTRFLKNLSKDRTRPRHFCFSCGRCWVVGAALHGWKWGAAVAPPRCLRCNSPCTRSSGYCDAGRTKLLHREPSYGWISADEDDDDDGAVPATESSSSSCSSCSASASQPVEEASSPCGTGGGDASTTETAAGVATAAAQDATRVDTKLPEAGFLDLDGNVLGGGRELTWEDIELIDCALQCYLQEEFRAAFFPLEGR